MISPRGNTSTWLDPRHDVLAPPVGLPHPIITCPGPRAYVKRERPTPRAQKEKTHSSVSANTSAIPVSLIGRLQSPLSHRLHLRRRIRSSRPHRLFHSSYSPKRFLPPSIIWSDPPISLPQVGRSVGRSPLGISSLGGRRRVWAGEMAAPPWLEPLLSTEFFSGCHVHGDAPRSECNMYCLDCNAGAFCFYCRSARHKDHHVVQVSPLAQTGPSLFSTAVWVLPFLKSELS